MTEFNYTLEPFSGEGPDACFIYRTSWRRSLLTKMSGRGLPFLNLGLLPRILGDEELAKHNPDGVETVKLTMPAALTGTPTNFAAAEFTYQRTNYYRQEQELAAAAAKIHDALGDTPKQLLIGEHGILITDLKTILRRLDAQYLTVTKREINEAMHMLEDRYEPGGDLKKLVAKHKAIHATLEDAKEGLPMHLKINYLIGAVNHIKALSECVDAYMRDQPDRTKHSFDALAAALNAHLANRPETIFSSGYANAMNSNARDSQSLTHRIEELERANQQLITRLEQAEARRRDFKYCWTHGKCAHTSQECDQSRRKEGHQPGATFKDQMGGRPAKL
jgi:hypothetical protein